MSSTQTTQVKPSTPADSGRDRFGRFTRGNRIGVGNPYHRRVHKLRAALFKDVSSGDIEEVVRELVRQAKGGDALAVRELLDRTTGVVHADLLKRVEKLERAVRELTALHQA